MGKGKKTTENPKMTKRTSQGRRKRNQGMEPYVPEDLEQKKQTREEKRRKVDLLGKKLHNAPGPTVAEGGLWAKKKKYCERS